MHIIDRGRAFVQSLRELITRSAWEWRRCPHCGSTDTWRWGTYSRHPWSFEGRQLVVVPRHRCLRCGRTYSEQSAYLMRGSWYTREVHRPLAAWSKLSAPDGGTDALLAGQTGAIPRLAALGGVTCPPVRCTAGWMGPGGWPSEGVEGQLAGVVSTEVAGTDGLWARLRGGAQRVV